MTVDKIGVEATIKKVQQLLAEEAHLSVALRAALEVLLVLVQLLANRLNLNSRNSSKPPSTDRFNKGNSDDKQGKNNKPGGQPGRIGTTLQKVDDPDEIKLLELDRATLPPGEYKVDGFESRQVFDIDIRRVVTEYRAEVLVDQFGNRFTASFPEAVTKAVQYGNGVKAQAVYLSQYQLIPYQRVQEQFQDQFQLPISVGSIFAFSCSPASSSIRLNTDLAKKPPECLEYIVVHEMTHLLEPTHNSRFVSLMDQFMPKWRFYKDELNKLPVRHETWIY